ncbi:MAG TPA: hypothetical protein VIM58_12110 [Candidatus Methylacidiphilales bacterium]
MSGIRNTLHELIQYLDEHSLWSEKIFTSANEATVRKWLEKSKDVQVKLAAIKRKKSEDDLRLEPYRQLFTRLTQLSESRATVELQNQNDDILKELVLLNTGKKFVASKKSKKSFREQMVDKLKKILAQHREQVL